MSADGKARSDMAACLKVRDALRMIPRDSRSHVRFENVRDCRGIESRLESALLSRTNSRGAFMLAVTAARSGSAAQPVKAFAKIFAWRAVAVRIIAEESIRVVDVSSAVDVGLAVNPDGVRNQI